MHSAPLLPDFDYAVVGSGIAGASVAWQLAQGATVVVLERESQPGYHSTGRSAAMFMESYGTPAIRLLTRASRAFYEAPPAGFADRPILSQRGALYVAGFGEEKQLEHAFQELLEAGGSVSLIDAAAAHARVPVLKPENMCGAIAEDDASDMDVNALLQGYVRGLRTRGGRVLVDAELVSAQRDQGMWTLALADGRTVCARTVVNAAGAWADAVARVCGAAPVGLEPRRRTAFTFAAPPGMDVHGWPVVISLDETFYFKPDAGQLLGSPANADPVAAHDVVPEELDVAIGIHRIEEATTLQIRRPASVWAGLRSFVADGDLVIGWDGACEGFFWLAAQGGYGIQTAAAASELAAALLRGLAVPPHIASLGFDEASVSPLRLHAAVAPNQCNSGVHQHAD